MPFTYTFPFLFFVPNIYQRQYLFEVHDASGKLVRFISGILGGEVEDHLNEPSEIVLTVSATDSGASALAGANEIWVRDQANVILGKYRIAEREETDGASGPAITIRGFSLLANLVDEFIFDYSATASIAVHLAAWFALQETAHPLTIGDLDADISALSREVTITEPTSILQAINLLEQTLSSYSMFWVDTDGAFRWDKLDTSQYSGKQVRFGKNLQTVRRTAHYGDQITRLYAYGSNEGGERVALATDYIETTWARWKYRKMIVLDHTDAAIGPKGQTPYNLPYVVTDPDLANASTENGSDIRFLQDDLATELTRVINSFTRSTGALDATVTIPVVSGVKDTVIYMLYGSY